MRGKKDISNVLTPNELEEMKRAPAAGFFGMRGKKQPMVKFYIKKISYAYCKLFQIMLLYALKQSTKFFFILVLLYTGIRIFWNAW